jgi:hypothetical protein
LVHLGPSIPENNVLSSVAGDRPTAHVEQGDPALTGRIEQIVGLSEHPREMKPLSRRSGHREALDVQELDGSTAA